ncbi:MAG: tail fiber domain-containing protein, partial [Dokdonella sp.]|uniref:tail fiber domain-containing protein n=1 Tax=Dokdonella sp. TaxID=2291710 RepID=UPI003BAE2878
YNTAVGKEAGPTSATLKNTAALGYKAIPASSNSVRIGNGSIVSIGGQVNWTVFSDERVKKDIRENVPGLSFIKGLRPVTYQYDLAKQNNLLGITNAPAKNDDDKDIEKIHFTGLIAQEVDKAATRAGYDFSGIDKTGPVMGLRYTEFIVPVIKAVQELAIENEELKKRLEKIEALLAAVTNASVSTQAAKLNTPLGAVAPSLEQNRPNPANATTVIPYHIPASAVNAKLIITDNIGNTVKSFTLTEKGNGQLTVDAGTLQAGTYYYTLFVDGKKADSKKMILAK